MKIPSLKGFPDQIKPTIEAVYRYQDLPYPRNKDMITDYLSKVLPELSPTEDPKIENLISAQAIPTCERLALITKDRKNRRLTFIGRKLAKSSNEKDFELILGKAILDFDTKVKIVGTFSELQPYPGGFIHFSDMIIALWKKGIDACEKYDDFPDEDVQRLRKLGIRSKGSRLSDLLQFYKDVRIVNVAEKTASLLRSRIIEIESYNVNRIIQDVSDVVFFAELYGAYRNVLQRQMPGSPYVPIIPYVREAVCERLNVGENAFNRKLLSLPSNIEGKRILLSPPMVVKRPDEVITKGRDIYYYISIYNEE